MFTYLFLVTLIFVSIIGFSILNSLHHWRKACDRHHSELHDVALHFYKQLYFKLQNLEEYPEVVQIAQKELTALLLRVERHTNPRGNMTWAEREQYDPNVLRQLLRNQQDETSRLWEKYTLSRQNGEPRKMFKDRYAAICWLRTVAPLKFVDGAWLGHINQNTMPFIYRKVIKNAWQILSEEYGDGDLKKHHVHVYRNLMDKLAPDLPDAHTPDFIEPIHGLDDPFVWRSAVVQLAISLFPHETLPEILGYNLHYESVKLDTLIIAKELHELDIDPYYFTLHISIDNPDSGHTAIALHAVEQYLAYISNIEGPEARDRAFIRVMNGFALSEYLEQPPGSAAEDQGLADSLFVLSDAAQNFIDLITRKIRNSDRIHCGSGVKLGGRRLADWLNPEFLSTPLRRIQFILCLGENQFWITKQNSERSRLICELSWGGKMFGAFTDSEVDVVKRWIESLNEPVYAANDYDDVGETFVEYGSFMSSPKDIDSWNQIRVTSEVLAQMSPLVVPRGARIQITKLLPLWFSHIGLLSGLISVPSRSASPARCAILQFLRAQAGFECESEGVAGMDEVKRSNAVGLTELGLEMVAVAGFALPDSLAGILERWPSELANRLLQRSKQPEKYAAELIGASFAFIDLHEELGVRRNLLGENSIILGEIAKRERRSLVKCINDSDFDHSSIVKMMLANEFIKGELQGCFY